MLVFYGHLARGDQGVAGDHLAEVEHPHLVAHHLELDGPVNQLGGGDRVAGTAEAHGRQPVHLPRLRISLNPYTQFGVFVHPCRLGSRVAAGVWSN